ncbi:putative homeoprotein [Podospora didyma]|uniref:Homeoprotein n=1 Tax=Podospora didyma TaxID=330526 RepID=A0AAE0K630_9PEZI|nr:putative homeoprotein [Podospora didyma]
MADVIKHEETLAPPSLAASVSPSSSHAPPPTPGSAGKNSQTPSPSTPASNSQSSASRRPPRKSTLTQQQKNQKRQRATQDQLTTLEQEFNKNPTPTATVRERIADEINMTERSVQIWFQNRRAKIKMMAKKSLETGEECDSIPESMRQYLALQAMESGKSIGGFFGRAGMMSYGHQGLLGADQGGQGKVLIHHLTCRSLSIGKWTRVGQNTMDLIIFYSPDKCTMTYYINNEQAGYKIEYPFAAIQNIFLNNAESDHLGGITIELLHPPNFYMDSAATSTGFFQVGDFTEEQQASRVMTHHLGGNPKVLSGQLAKLVSLEAFIHRHSPSPMFDQLHHPLSMSAPVSPTARPSSQPNFAQPHVGMFQETQWGIAAHHGMMMRGGPGHKRQRSRSVPGPIDFHTMQMLQNPPSFHITQHENQHHNHNPHLFSPIPQQPNMLGPIGPNLRIDTQAGFGSLDMRNYPMSATTAPSPSDYSSPNFFASQAPDSNSIQAASYTPYSGTFSPLINPSNLGIPPSISPLSFNHQDPAIVGESPPMSMPAICEGSAMSDDGSGLNEMYQNGKHTMTLPLHPHSPFADTNQADLELNQFMDLKHFDVDPASLSPESIHHGQ